MVVAARAEGAKVVVVRVQVLTEAERGVDLAAEVMVLAVLAVVVTVAVAQAGWAVSWEVQVGLDAEAEDTQEVAREAEAKGMEVMAAVVWAVAWAVTLVAAEVDDTVGHMAAVEKVAVVTAVEAMVHPRAEVLLGSAMAAAPRVAGLRAARVRRSE